MATTKRRVAHKHFQLDTGKLRRAQRVLQAKTETETIERALDKVIDDDERDRIVHEAHERFLNSGIQIVDVFSKMED